ncbi:MAG: hypothetical protein A2284_00120 [Deltaproteobacteria bacterium RIFOXYA12_FULL_61_11]|nr:MAG: hypothetical protein A2284_00120 [Deltaproteobacteria bacterium RIFOXYA12_FULL_61_11]
MIELSSVETREGHLLVCVSTQGEQRIFDLSDILALDTVMVRPLRDPAYCASVFLEAGAPCWPNGYELCPDAIWLTTGEQTCTGQ